MLLALHHVNSRDACIVGNETLSRIPENFKISFKMKNSDFIPTGAAEALTTWTYMHRFLNDACRLLNQENLTVSSTPGITTEVLERCRDVGAEDKCDYTALYEASHRENIDAVVGLPSSKSSITSPLFTTTHSPSSAIACLSCSSDAADGAGGRRCADPGKRRLNRL